MALTLTLQYYRYRWFCWYCRYGQHCIDIEKGYCRNIADIVDTTDILDVTDIANNANILDIADIDNIANIELTTRRRWHWCQRSLDIAMIMLIFLILLILPILYWHWCHRIGDIAYIDDIVLTTRKGFWRTNGDTCENNSKAGEITILNTHRYITSPMCKACLLLMPK